MYASVSTNRIATNSTVLLSLLINIHQYCHVFNNINWLKVRRQQHQIVRSTVSLRQLFHRRRDWTCDVIAGGDVIIIIVVTPAIAQTVDADADEKCEVDCAENQCQHGVHDGRIGRHRRDYFNGLLLSLQSSGDRGVRRVQ